jgi:CMP-N,N'-diacetyllegionaminic acid synthase
MTLSDFIIHPHEPLRLALERMTRNHGGILFVCDEDLHLVGVLSDGDVRRTLLADTLLVAAVSKAMNTDPISALTSEEATKLLRQFGLAAVPVVGKDGRIREAVLEVGSEIRILRLESGEYADASGTRRAGALAIIPARGGSKRVPRKNLAMACGKSLLGWAISAAQDAERVGRILVSTDAPEIAEAARAAGVDVPWLRPAALAQDDSPTLDVVIHAIQWALENVDPKPEFAVLLEPTAPLRTAKQIDDALEMLASGNADSVVTVSELPHVLNPEEMLTIGNNTLRSFNTSRTLDMTRPRTSQEPVYIRNGLVYALRISSVLANKSLYGSKTAPLITPWEYFLDVDTPNDLQWADHQLRSLNRAEHTRP